MSHVKQKTKKAKQAAQRRRQGKRHPELDKADRILKLRKHSRY